MGSDEELLSMLESDECKGFITSMNKKIDEVLKKEDPESIVCANLMTMKKKRATDERSVPTTESPCSKAYKTYVDINHKDDVEELLMSKDACMEQVKHEKSIIETDTDPADRTMITFSTLLLDLYTM